MNEVSGEPFNKIHVQENVAMSTCAHLTNHISRTPFVYYLNCHASLLSANLDIELPNSSEKKEEIYYCLGML